MIVFVRYNQGPAVAVELREEARVAELKEVVGDQQGVRAERLRVLFAGRELRSSSTLRGCDLPEQSTVHVLPPPAASSSSSSLQEDTQGQLDQDQDLDLHSTSFSGPPAGEGEAEPTGAGCRSRITFYVFCKSCKAVRPGKLRVRCQSCRQNTLTVSRGPSCWDDVLIRGRIHGECQSESCHGNEAEFYMKCSSHPTPDDDPSVTLDLIVTNTRDVPCISCCDILDVVLVFQCAERHVICLDCFRRYSQTRLNERQFVSHPVIGYSLPCAAGCRDSLIKELHHFRILGEDQYGRYLHYGAEECLLMSGGLMCPSPGCGAGLVPGDAGRRVECDRQLGCGFVFCRDCRESYHEGACHTEQAPPPGEASEGFQVEEEALLRGRWDQASLRLLQESTKRCPQCSVPVERNGGCMHMHCPLCQAEWCWLCGVPWNRECMGDHWFG